MDPVLIEKIIPLVITHGVAFLLFVWILNVFAVKPVLRLLDDRRHRIAQQFEEIDVAQKRVEGLKTEYEEHLRKIEEEARTRMLEEVNKGRRIGEEIAEKARLEATALVEKARANVDIQVRQAREQIKQDMVEMVLAASERLIREQVDDARHREMVSAFVEELDRKPASGTSSN